MSPPSNPAAEISHPGGRVSRRSVIFVQPYVPAYRVPFFEGLSATLDEAGLDMRVLCAAPPAGREDGRRLDVSVEVQDLLGPMTGDRLRLRHLPLRLPASDLVVVEHAVKNLDTYPLLLSQKLSGPPVAMWGHGTTHGSGRLRDLTKAAMTRRADWFFAYTPEGAAAVADMGFPKDRITTVNNSIDTAALSADLLAIGDSELVEYRRRLGLRAGRVGLFLGRLEEGKGLKYLHQVCYQLAAIDPDFVLLVGGAGSQSHELAGLTNVRLLGRLDGMDKAYALRAADVMLIPEWIGLVAVESLVGAVPIGSLQDHHHMPEAQYLVPDVTTVFLPSDTDATTFASQLAALLDDRGCLQAMSDSCAALSQNFSIASMIDRFAEGLLRWQSRRI